MCFSQAADNGVSEAAKFGIVSGIKTLFFDKFPETLDQIKIGRIRRQKKQFDFERGRQILDDLGSLIAGIIQNQGDRRLEIETGDFPEQIADALTVDVGVIDDGDQFVSHGIQSSEDVETLPAGWRFHKESYRAPEISQERR